MLPPLAPTPSGQAGLSALKAIWQSQSVLPALQAFHHASGDVFRIGLPGFQPTFLAGADACQFVLSTARQKLLWQNENDPVAKLLGHGVLVTDGAEHDHLRALQEPALHQRMFQQFMRVFVQRTRQVTAQWQDGGQVDMLVEMRKIALLILVDSLFGADFSPQLRSLWQAILKTLRYISPGLWLIFPDLPRPGYRSALQAMDNYLFQLIAERKQRAAQGDDLLALLIQAGLSDSLIRDQLLTMLIAGHDTSTALLAWTFLSLGQHPHILADVYQEMAQAALPELPSPEQLKQLALTERVLAETLRLYPPIHAGNRLPAEDLTFNGYRIPAHQRVIYSIYLTQRHPDSWQNPNQFQPDRFLKRPPAWTYLPFGGGPRICIGYQYAQVEAKAVLLEVLRHWQVQLLSEKVHLHMGATLEPRPGVQMRVTRR
jgi:cytochrome P450